MRSDAVKKGLDKAPARSLLRADGLDDSDFDKPFIAIANSWNEVVPGHIHLNEIVEAVKEGIIEAGGKPFVFGVPAVCDGIARGHKGMGESLGSSEGISDAAQRRANVLGVYKMVPGQDVAGKRFLRLDDILTTGATAGEAARILRTAGAKEVHCAAVAAARK